MKTWAERVRKVIGKEKMIFTEAIPNEVSVLAFARILLATFRTVLPKRLDARNTTI